MITLASQSTSSSVMKVKFIAAGNSGCNILDRLSLSLGGSSETAALNTDAQSLTACVAGSKVLIGMKTTRGLGSGGDPELGAAALEESFSEVDPIVEEADIFVLSAGLGGGTGGTTLAYLAKRIHESQKHAVAILTLPFSFEGKRRTAQAEADLAAIRRHADVVAVFPNDGMSDIPVSHNSIAETFSECDVLLSAVAASLLEIFRSKGPLQLSAGDLFGSLSGRGAKSLFSHAVASGANRANEVVGRALKSPLLRAGLPLEEVSSLVLNISSGTDLTFVEVQAVLEQLHRHLDDSVRLKVGISTGNASKGELGLTLFGISKSEKSHHPTIQTPPAIAVAQPAPKPIIPQAPKANLLAAVADISFQEQDEDPVSRELTSKLELDEPDIPLPDIQPKTPDSSGDQSDLFPGEAARADALSGQRPAPKKAPPKPRQEILPLDVATRGPFEKSEPTIVEGEDLDIPTFLRLKIKLK